MALIRWRNDVWRPAEELRRLQSEINELFDFQDVFPGRGIFDRSISPALDMLETEDGFVVYCDLPGMTEKGLELSVASNVRCARRISDVSSFSSFLYKMDTFPTAICNACAGSIRCGNMSIVT